MIPEQKIILKWHVRNREFYELKGYSFTKYKDEFEVNLNDLSHGSEILVRYICDYCKGENQTTKKEMFKEYFAILTQRKTTNKDCCSNSDCSSKKMQESWIFNLNKKKETLGHKYPHLIEEWSENNQNTPFQYSHGSKKEVEWKCKNGHTWETSILSRTLGENGCPYCAGIYVCDDNCLNTHHPELSKEWDWDKNKEITPFNVTRGSSKFVWWKCSTCEHEWRTKVSTRTLLRTGCPECKESKGEKEIRKILLSNKLNFNSQYEFNDLRGIGGKCLKFDFVVFDEAKNIVFLVEYDGIFHFEKQYEDDNYTALKEHDNRKNVYCKQNNIPLIRIPYWEFDNIEKILIEELTKYGVQTPN